MKKYFENTRYYQCTECKHFFRYPFWQWLGVIFKWDISRHSYVECPRCGARHWLQAKKK
jgi:DNA-directed RNA polymerase subunit RPC12/RpoP